MNRIIIFRAYGVFLFYKERNEKKPYIFDRKINGVDTHSKYNSVINDTSFPSIDKKSGDEMDYFCLRHGEALHATTNAS